MFCDNMNAKYLSQNPIMRKRSKYIEIDIHFIFNKVLRKQLLMKYCPFYDPFDGSFGQP